MTTSNDNQRAYWNETPGRMWVEFQAELDQLHAEAADLLLARAAPSPGENLLDVGCGAGATTLAAARMVSPGGTVLGLDISAPLVDLANDRIKTAALPNATVQLADVQTDRPGAAPFDKVISRFGVMFFADPVAAFANIRSLTRPGAPLVFACWQGPADNMWFRLPMVAATDRLGPAEATDPDAPGPMAFRDPARVTGILSAAGYSDISVTPAEIHLHLDDLEAALRMTRRIGPMTRLLQEKSAGEADLDAIMDRLRSDLMPFDGPSGFAIPAGIHIVRAIA
ncbi:class I SAM-dependent methyltransferase [Pseudooceanicola sp. C21-150M6]|uniref:class I SAM-dependent methyltransferase n=1 Tax=Pseudooceanicola sp. C21-150M6 TaxID=3434355 RepID=UPI003D7F8E29